MKIGRSYDPRFDLRSDPTIYNPTQNPNFDNFAWYGLTLSSKTVTQMRQQPGLSRGTDENNSPSVYLVPR